MSNKLRYLRPVASYSSPLCLRLAIYHFKSELQLNFLRLSIPLRATAFKFATSNSFRFRYVRQLSSLLRPTAFDSLTCDSFQVRYVQQLSISLRATAFKSATSNSFRFRYVRQLSSSLRPTAFDSVTCDSFQACYVQQLSIPLRATAFKFATSNSFQVLSVYEPLPHYFCFDTRSVTQDRLLKIGCSLYILSQLDHAYSIYFTDDPLILLSDSPGLHGVMRINYLSVTKNRTKLYLDTQFPGGL